MFFLLKIIFLFQILKKKKKRKKLKLILKFGEMEKGEPFYGRRKGRVGRKA